MNRDIAVFQIITRNWFGAILTGAVLGLSPGTAAVAQTADDSLSPIPQNRPSIESYSLPPGPNSSAEQNKLQGPADPEIPLANPVVVAPRSSPAKAPSPERPPQAGSQPTASATTDSKKGQTQQEVSQTPLKPAIAEEAPATETNSSPLPPADAADERDQSTAAPTAIAIPPMDTAAEPVPATADNDWVLLSFAALLAVLLGALFLWRARRTSPRQPVDSELDVVEVSPKNILAKLPETPAAAPAIDIGFQPRSANATLINAVLSFDLTLSHHGSEVLKNIKISGAMVQAENDGSRAPDLTSLVPLQEVPGLQSNEPQTIRAEFRIPLAGINPIVFQSQALFVPMVQIGLEYTDGLGLRHFQTAAFLVGREHQPPRPRMAPFRLDLGPRSFTPLGYRALTAG